MGSCLATLPLAQHFDLSKKLVSMMGLMRDRWVVSKTLKMTLLGIHWFISELGIELITNYETILIYSVNLIYKK